MTSIIQDKAVGACLVASDQYLLDIDLGTSPDWSLLGKNKDFAGSHGLNFELRFKGHNSSPNTSILSSGANSTRRVNYTRPYPP